MVNLPKITDLDVVGKPVIVRMDLDVDDDYTRLELAEETLDYLVAQKARVIIIGHKGRPEGERLPELSLEPLAGVLGGIVGEKVNFFHDVTGYEVEKRVKMLSEGDILLLENLRFDKSESLDPAQDAGAAKFANDLASLGEVYVNEAFAVSHREHVSIVGLPSLLPHSAGFRFMKEVENLSKVLDSPRRPVVLVVGGIKKDKVEYIQNFTRIADKILVGGRLPLFYESGNPDPEKIVLADLIQDKEDITLSSIDKFKQEIAKAGTLVIAGVPGKYEDEGHRQGTEAIFGAIAGSSAFKLAGGGDAEAAITFFGLNAKFDWISVGGGASLDFLAKGTLPGIEALVK